MKIASILSASVLSVLCACSSSRNLAVGESTDAAAAPGSGKGPCKADVRCLPNGNCLITCTGPNGKKCEVELKCDQEQCEVVRCDGGGCLGNSGGR